jgi:transposase
VQAYSNATEKHGAGKFTIKFRQAKRMRQETITLRCCDWGRERGVYSSTFRADRLRASKPLPAIIQRDFKVIRTRLGQYYLSIPVDLDMRGENQAPVPRWASGQGGDVVAIDPGVRTPFTCFDPQGYVYEIGNKDFGRIKGLYYHMDDLQSRFSERDIRKKRRYRMRRVWLRMHRRVRNLVDDLHRKTVKWLCESYRVILYPHYETSNMVIRERRAGDPYACTLRGLSSKTARAMLTWAHFRFKQHLLHKIREYPWCRVVLVNEAYTSKTCSECGYIHRGRFRRYDTFQCGACTNVVDRDWNGARGIWLRFLTEWAGDPVA